MEDKENRVFRFEALKLAIGVFQASGLYKVSDELGDNIIKVADKFTKFIKEK